MIPAVLKRPSFRGRERPMAEEAEEETDQFLYDLVRFLVIMVLLVGIALLVRTREPITPDVPTSTSAVDQQ